MPEDQTEVLVVGAGPVGLLSALLLAQAGVEVRIIDREERTAARSYACALHPSTLNLLSRLGLADPILEQGKRLQTLAFYDSAGRRAEVDLTHLGGDFPFLLVLPQSALEKLLEERLQQAGVRVQWNHRFDALEQDEEKVVSTIEKLGGTATGYIVPHWEMVVKSRHPLHAEFVVGADGANSLVRARLDIEQERISGPDFFVAYEFEADQKSDDQVRVVLDQRTTNVLWPLRANQHRWTFQIVKSEVESEFPEKERRAVHFAPRAVDERVRDYVQRVAARRAPWFTTKVQEITWCTEVAFAHRRARSFGRNRCWLAGDAAHQTGPVGAQSMNVGFREAKTLAETLVKILRKEAPLTSLEAYNRQQQAEWGQLLGVTSGFQATAETDPWVRENRARILSCLPGSGDDLGRLAAQLKLVFS